MSFLFPVGFLLGQSILQEGAYNKSLSVTMLTFCPSMQGQVDFYHLFHYEKHWLTIPYIHGIILGHGRQEENKISLNNKKY
jgi:hypothetical protein